MTSRRPLLVVATAAVSIAAAAFLLWGADGSRDAAALPPSGAEAVAAESQASPPSQATARDDNGAPGPSQVRRVSADERRKLGAQIAAAIQRAQKARPPSERGPPEEDVDLIIPLEEVAKPLQDALQKSVGILAECFEKNDERPREAMARMTMFSDPDLGTVIDTERITGDNDQPVDAALDTCMRDKIDSLALPPLGKQGKVQVQYTFKFD